MREIIWCAVDLKPPARVRIEHAGDFEPPNCLIFRVRGRFETTNTVDFLMRWRLGTANPQNRRRFGRLRRLPGHPARLAGVTARAGPVRGARAGPA
jgi:hypothetical protein